MKIKIFLNLFYCLFSISQVFSQVVIDQTFEDQALQKVLLELEQKHGLRFYYIPQWIEDVRVNKKFENATLEEFFNTVLSEKDFSFLTYRERHIVLLKKVPDDMALPSVVSEEKIKKRKAGIVVGDPTEARSNSEATINGYIREAKTGEVIIGATFYIEELETGTSTNSYGFYSLTVPVGEYHARVNYLGWQEENYLLKVYGDGSFNVDLFEDVVRLEGVTVTDIAEDQNISNVQTGLTKLNVTSIRQMPALFGESDVIKSIQLLPGVSTVGEGAQGFNVRGGSVGENLILLEGAPIYNSSHLFGFFSLFNAELVKDATLYKGGVPARYGGRTASVLDVKLKDGNLKKWTGSGGLGFVTTRVAVEGPLKKEKSALTLGARVAYPDWILNRLRDVELRESSARFYDINGKVNYRFNDNNKLTLMGYNSQDRFKFASDTLFRYRNTLASLSWEHVFNEKLFSNFSLVASDYQYEVEGLQPQFRFLMDFGIKYYGIKGDFTYYPNPDHKIDFGANTGKYTISPGVLRTLEITSLIQDEVLENEEAIESGFYVSDEIRFNNSLSVFLGLRYSTYSQIGPERIFQYQQEAPLSPETITDTLFVGSGEIIKTYQGFEPRVSVRYNLSPFNSVKFSYNRLRQYIHLISNTAAVTPFDIWKSSDTFLAPQISDQVAGGVFQNFAANSIETSVEVFYRWLDNVPQYKNAADLILNPALEADLIIGEGRAYGAEFLVKKNYGRLTGWAGYTLSRTERKASGRFPEERINDGNYYPADFDHRHDFTAVSNYKISRRWKLSANFSYITGRPITIPTALFSIGNISQAQFSERNEYRIPDFHRLDVSITFDSGHRKNLKWENSWTLTVFNVYGRNNPFSVFFGREGMNSSLRPLQLSVLGSAFPSLTYNFKF